MYHSHTQFASDRNWALTQVVTLDRRAPAFLDVVPGPPIGAAVSDYDETVVQVPLVPLRTW